MLQAAHCRRRAQPLALYDQGRRARRVMFELVSLPSAKARQPNTSSEPRGSLAANMRELERLCCQRRQSTLKGRPLSNSDGAAQARQWTSRTHWHYHGQEEHDDSAGRQAHERCVGQCGFPSRDAGPLR